MFIVELDGPNSAGVDFDLYVYRPSCPSDKNNWLCRSSSYSADEKCTTDDAPSGNYYLRVVSFNGAGNFKLSAKLSHGDVDLYAPPPIVSPSSPSDKDSLTIGYGVGNVGTDKVKYPSYSRLFLDNAQFDECLRGALDPRETKTCFKDNAKLSSGSHTLKNKADADDSIIETDETNNEESTSVTVRHKTDYDLSITDIWTYPGGELNDRMTFSVTAEITNSGSDGITNSFKAYLTADDEPSRSKVCSFSSLKAGTSAFCTLENQKWTAGKHTVEAHADKPDASIDETNEENNARKEEFTVIHIADADLVVTSIHTIPAALNNKTEFELRLETKNTGAESALKPYTSKLYVNGQEKMVCEESSALAGITETCQLKNQKWQPGTYKLKAIADTANSIDETNENNNEMEESIVVEQYCPVPDGSAADCECDTYGGCPSGYYCDFRPGYNPCVKQECKDECSQGYLCSQGDAYECGNFDPDPCMEKKLKQVCSLFDQKCNAAIGSCDAVTSPVKLRLEDAPSHGILVYKQPGDTVEVTITSERLQDVDFSYPVNFTLMNGICSAKTAAGAGETKCLFQISQTTAFGEYFFTANEKLARVVVVTAPKSIIITNRQKLYERFQNDKTGVKALLEQAFQFAHNERDTVVYYLDREVEGHPFQGYGSYGESILSPEMTDNTYTMNSAEMAAKKCGGCSSIIVLGDDFVVPFYRADYALIHNWWQWWVENKSETRFLYSDQPYIKEKKKTVGELKSLFNPGEHRYVKLVVPDAVSTEIQAEIDRIKEAVKALSYQDSDIKQVKSSDIGCNSYGALDEATLILVGTREDNNAIKCVPWFDIGSKPTDTFKASIEIERNVWANNEYAIIVSGTDIRRGLQNLYVLLNNPDYFKGTALGQKDTVYIHEFSNPPDMPPGLKEAGSHIVGFALGTCEEGKFIGAKGACIATDMIAGVVPPTDIITDIRDVVLYCPAFIWNKITGKETSGWNGLACGGSAAGTGITIGKYVTAVTGVGAVAGEVADVGSTALKTVLKVSKAALKGESDRFIKFLDKIQLFKFDNAWKFFKATGKDSLFSGVQRFVKTTTEDSFYINKLTGYFSEETLSGVIKTVDDYQALPKGTKKALTNAKSFDDIAPEASELAKATFLKNLGAMEEAAAESVAKLSDIKGVDKLADNIVKQPSGGFKFEAEVAAKLKSEGKELEEVSKKITTKIGDTEIDAFLKNGDIYEEKIHDWVRNPPGSKLYNDLKRDLGEKISRFKAFQQANNFVESKITIVFKGSVESGMETWLKTEKNVLVEVMT